MLYFLFFIVSFCIQAFITFASGYDGKDFFVFLMLDALVAAAMTVLCCTVLEMLFKD